MKLLWRSQRRFLFAHPLLTALTVLGTSHCAVGGRR